MRTPRLNLTGITPVVELWKFVCMVLAQAFPDLLKMLLHLLLHNELVDIQVGI